MTAIAALTIVRKKIEQHFQELSAEEDYLLSTLTQLHQDLTAFKGVMNKIESKIQTLNLADDVMTTVHNQTKALYHELWKVEHKYHNGYNKFREMRSILQPTSHSLIQIDKERKLLNTAIPTRENIECS